MEKSSKLKRQIKFFGISLLLIGIGFFYFSPKADSFEDISRVKMSYEHTGGWRGTGMRVDIQGNGEATCVLGSSSTFFRLKPDVVKAFMVEYEKLNFLDYNFEEISSVGAEDAGLTTLTFQDEKINKSVSYEVIKNKVSGGVAVPLNTGADTLARLQKLYEAVILQKKYTDELNNYQKLDNQELESCFFSLENDAEFKRLIDNKAFVPVMIKMLSDKKILDSKGLCQKISAILETITGDSPNDGRDCNGWLGWWEKNKTRYENN